VMPEYGEVHSQVLQEVVQRVDRAFHAFFRSPARCALAAAFWSRKAYPFVGMLVRTADKSAPGPQRRRGRVAWAASENRESLPGVSMCCTFRLERAGKELSVAVLVACGRIFVRLPYRIRTHKTLSKWKEHAGVCRDSAGHQERVHRRR
jgi:hypothetical protein